METGESADHICQTDIKMIRPGVVVDGQTIYPPNWLWQLAFAIAGCGWAIEACETNDWKERVREHFVQQERSRLERQIAYYENTLQQLREELWQKEQKNSTKKTAE